MVGMNDGMSRAPSTPVIVTHLADDQHSGWTACGGEMPLEVPSTYAHVPRYLCQACAQSGKGQVSISVIPVYELALAIKLTQEYVGDETLPRQEGWSWFDALMKYYPSMLEQPEKSDYDGGVTSEDLH